MTRKSSLCVVAFVVLTATMAAPAYGQVSEFLANQFVEWQVPLQPDDIATQFSEVNGQLLFSLGPYRERSVYQTDGVTVSKIGDIPDAISYASAQNKVFYFNASALSDSTMYSTDGTALDSLAVGPLGYWDYDLIIGTQTRTVGDKLFYRGHGPNGWEVFRTDGATIDSFGVASPELPWIHDELGDRFFVTAAPTENQRQLYAISDQVMLPIQHKGHSLIDPGRFVEFAGHIFFSAHAPGSSTELYKTDGVTATSLGVFKMYDDYLVTEDELFFWGHRDGSSARKRVYSTNGTDITDFGFEMLNGNTAEFLATLNGEAVFKGRNSDGTGLYRTDGEGTKLIMPLRSYPVAPRHDSVMIEYEGELYFPANSPLAPGTMGLGLFKTNGEEAEYIDTLGGPVERRPLPIGVVGDSLLFSAEGPAGYELLRIHGESLDWFDLNPDGHSFPAFLTEFGGNMFISAEAPGGPVFVTDGVSVTGLGNVSLWNGEDALYLVNYNGSTPTLFKLSLTGEIDADFNNDGRIDAADVDQLHGGIDAGSNSPMFDLNGDGLVDAADVDAWLAAAAEDRGFSGPIRRGDTDLNGIVDAKDLNTIGINWQSVGATSWTQGDFDNDGTVDASDLNFVAAGWRSDVTQAAAATTAVPEPSSLALTMCGVLVFVWRRRPAA